MKYVQVVGIVILTMVSTSFLLVSIIPDPIWLMLSNYNHLF